MGSMGWILFKVADFLIKASNVLLLVAVIGLLLALVTRRRWPIWIAALGVLGIAVLSLIPVGEWLIIPLENRFPLPVRYPARIDGVVAISDRINADITRARGETYISGAAERPLALIELGRQYPDAKLILTGLGESTSAYAASGAAAMRQFYGRLGFDPDRVTYEDKARSFRDFARATLDIAKPAPGQHWLLVTSAAEMPRSIGTFRAAGWGDAIQAWPVDFATTGVPDPIAPHLRITYYLWEVDWAVAEWVSLAAYHWKGWTDQLFPGPAPAAAAPAPVPVAAQP
jgi:uncharacterized SAM-binding protein YcdF (DUF218 family)